MTLNRHIVPFLISANLANWLMAHIDVEPVAT